MMLNQIKKYRKDNNLLSQIELTPKVIRNIISEYINIIEYDFKDEEVESVKYLTKMFDFETKYVFEKFNSACLEGQIVVASELNYIFKFSPEILNRFHYLIFRKTCEKGHLNIAKYLANNTNLEELYILNYSLLKNTCINGHLEVSEWLYDNFALCHDDENFNEVDYVITDIFQSTCESENLEVIKWVVYTFGISKSKVNSYTFSNLCKNGNLEATKWLCENFNLNRYDIKLTNDTLLTMCKNGHLNLIKWFVEFFNVTKEEISFADFIFYRVAYRNNHLELAEWLRELINN